LKTFQLWLKKGALCFNLEIPEDLLFKFQAYTDLLLEWNRRHNLTALRTEEEVAVKHFLDSLAGFLTFSPREDDLVLDLGSGAGFPGVPLKLLNPHFPLILLEPRLHAAQFLNELLPLLEIDAEVIRDRAENAGRGELREKCQWVVSRAVARLNQLLELGLPFLRLGGYLIAWKQEEVKEEIEEARFALEELGGKLEKIVPYTLPYWDLTRNLLVVKKVEPTPEKYPRRAGIPAKRPLLSRET